MPGILAKTLTELPAAPAHNIPKINNGENLAAKQRQSVATGSKPTVHQNSFLAQRPIVSS